MRVVHSTVVFQPKLVNNLKSKVLIFCVEFRELSHLTRDLSQAEKKITVVTSHEQLTILSEIDVILCICSVCNNIYY